jgi:hypothetical protein
MSEYYKVVRPDLSSFSDPTYVYVVGRRMRPTTRGDRLCAAGLLHASPTPEQAATYGRWPYRLLAVEGRPVVEDTDKAGFRQLTVVEELPVVRCFGPSGDLVLEVLRQVGEVTDWAAARAAARAAGAAAWDAAWAAAWDAARAATRAAGDATRAAAWAAARAATWDAAGSAAGAATRAAAVADLVGQHGLTQQHLDTLSAPWRAAYAAGKTPMTSMGWRVAGAGEVHTGPARHPKEVQGER